MMDSNENLLKLVCTLLNVDQMVLDRKDWDAALAEIDSFANRVADEARADEQEWVFKKIRTVFDTMRGGNVYKEVVLHTLDTIKPYLIGKRKGNEDARG